MKNQMTTCDFNGNGFPLPYLVNRKSDYTPRLFSRIGKKSFLVFRHNQYITVPTDRIAFLYRKQDSTMIVDVDRQEYPVYCSLDQVRHTLPEEQFFRLNHQYLINFRVIKKVNRYFASKLLVKLTVPAPDRLLVSRAKASGFLNWLESLRPTPGSS